MPSISMFYGILVFLYYGDDDRHHAPHIHARYQDHKVSVAIDSGEVLANWELAKAGDTPFRIRPLE